MLCWIPSHTGLKENKLVDSVAKEAQNGAFKIPYSDRKERAHVCVCVCVCMYIYIYIYIYNQTKMAELLG